MQIITMNINSHPCDFLLYAPLFNSSQKPVDLFAVEGPDEVAGHVQAKGQIISWWDSGQPQVLWGWNRDEADGGLLNPHPVWKQ